MTPDRDETPSPDETALIRAVVAAPDDDLPRLVYADWLDERGRADRARLIRVQCAIEQLRAEEASLLDRHGREWAGDLFANGIDRWKFHRGFPEEVTMPFRDYMALHGRLNDVTPLTRLTLTHSATGDLDADLAALARLPAARQIRSLDVGFNDRPTRSRDVGPAGLRALATATNLSGLRELTVRGRRVGPTGAAVVADSPNFARLTRLHIPDPAANTEAGLVRLLDSPRLPDLDDLRLGDLSVSVRTARSLAGRRPPPERSGPGVGR